MSGTRVFGRIERAPSRWLWGACAELSERAAVPVWVPRLAFLLFAAMHVVLAGILYAALAHLLDTRRYRRVRTAARSSAYRPPADEARFSDIGAVDQRFRNLDTRVSQLEASALNAEAELRRAFWDLERRQ